MSQFLHGVEVIEIDDGARPIQTVKSAVIGLIGTAPNAAQAVSASLQHGSYMLDDGLVLTAKTAGIQGNGISVEIVQPTEADQSLNIAVDSTKITVTLATDSNSEATSTANEIKTALDAEADVASIITVTVLGKGDGEVGPLSRSNLSGGINEAFPLNTPVAVGGNRKHAEKLGKAGTLFNAMDDIFDQCGALVIVVRVAEGANSAETQANVITGMQSFLDAQTKTGYTPRILIGTEYSHLDAVAAELEAKAQRLRAIAYIDNDIITTSSDAIKRARKFGSRVELSWPPVKVFDTEQAKEVTRPYSARQAGLRARIDGERGFWHSKSNNHIYGITGTAQPVDWSLGDANALANQLNENKVSTIIREGGFRHWGNRTCSTDPKCASEHVRRTRDMINDSIQRAHLWAVDRNITKTYIEDVVNGVNAYLRELKALGAIAGGECWADKELNTPATMQKGIVYFNFDFAPYGVAEHIVFQSRINNDYLEEVFK